MQQASLDVSVLRESVASVAATAVLVHDVVEESMEEVNSVQSGVTRTTAIPGITDPDTATVADDIEFPNENVMI